MEILPEDTDPAISSDNVEAMVMLMDYLSKNHNGNSDFKYKGFNQVLEGDHDEIAEAIVQHYRYELCTFLFEKWLFCTFYELKNCFINIY